MQTASGLNDIAHGIQLAVAPVFLLSGVGVILTVLTNRLARIVDRARSLEGTLPPAGDTADEVQAELRTLSRLGRDLSMTIVVLFIAALCAFIGGLIFFLLEIRAATSSLHFG
jgi:hypothetical protein